MSRRIYPDPSEIDIGAGFDHWGIQRPLKWWGTYHMLDEEHVMIEHVETHGPVVKLWKMLDALAVREGRKHKYMYRPESQRLIALFIRLTKEGKLVRHRSSQTVTVGLEPPTPRYPELDDVVQAPALDDMRQLAFGSLA